MPTMSACRSKSVSTRQEQAPKCAMNTKAKKRLISRVAAVTNLHREPGNCVSWSSTTAYFASCRPCIQCVLSNLQRHIYTKVLEPFLYNIEAQTHDMSARPQLGSQGLGVFDLVPRTYCVDHRRANVTALTIRKSFKSFNARRNLPVLDMRDSAIPSSSSVFAEVSCIKLKASIGNTEPLVERASLHCGAVPSAPCGCSFPSQTSKNQKW
eukprot:723828-Amphidinium_carterae.1